MDAGKREIAGMGGSGRSDSAKAQAKEIESLKIVAGEQDLVIAELKKMGAFMSSLANRASALRAMGLRVVMNLPRTRVSGSLTQVSSGRRYTAQTVNGVFRSTRP